MENEENKNDPKLIELVLKNSFGLSYFIASIAIIIICIVFGILIGTVAPFPYAWILLGLCLAYCLFILIGEIIRSGVINRIKKENADKKE